MVAALTVLQLAIATCLTLRVQAETVQYFYNQQKDTCAWGANSIPANNNTLNGGLCSYVSSIRRVYACPAPDPACWTWGQQCTNNGNPGPNQIQCNRGGTIWCCQNQETCTVTKGQINICISQFYSLNSGVSAADANINEFAAIPSASIATTAVTALPSIISSTTFVLANVGTSSTSSSTNPTSSSRAPSSSTRGTSTTGTAASTASTSSETPKDGFYTNHSSLPGGAIAGIVIGALVVVAMICGTIIYVVRNRRRNQRGPGQTATTTAALSSSALMNTSYSPAPQVPTSYYEKASTPLVEADSGPGYGNGAAGRMDPYAGGRHELQ